MILDVVSVKTKPNYQLEVGFENGETRIFNMGEHIEQQPWARIRSLGLFQAAYVRDGTVCWQGNIDIDPETLYDLSKPIS